jgi:hypothetical protein
MELCFQSRVLRSLGIAIFLFMTGRLTAQTALAITSAAAGTDRVTLELSLDSSSGIAPAALQWTFEYPPSAIRSITIQDGPALAAAGKTALCSGVASPVTCIAVGSNRELVPDGVVAMVTVVLDPGESTPAIEITDAMGVSAAGYEIPIVATSGTIIRSAHGGFRSPFRLRVTR